MEHFWNKRVLDLVKTRFYWPSCEKDIYDIVTINVAVLKKKKMDSGALLANTVNQNPYIELILMDNLYLHKSKRDYEWLLDVTDFSTKYV